MAAFPFTREVAETRPVAGHLHGDAAGLMPKQLDRRERGHSDLQHLAVVRQLVADAIRGDPGQHELGDHQDQQDRSEPQEGGGEPPHRPGGYGVTANRRRRSAGTTAAAREVSTSARS